jgi:sensor histidine kinase YesM
MKRNSVVSQVRGYLLVQFIIIFIVLFVYIINTYSDINKARTTSVENMLNVYGSELQNKLDNSDALMEQVLYKNTELELIQSDEESERVYASLRLKGQLEEVVTYNRYVDIFVIADAKYNNCIDYESKDLDFAYVSAVREYSLKQAEKKMANAKWKIVNLDGTKYICKLYVWQSKAVGTFINLDNFMNKEQGQESDASIVLKRKGTSKVLENYGVPIEELKDYNPVGERFYFDETDYYLQAYASKNTLVGFLTANVASMLILFIVLVSFTIVIISFVRKNIASPIKGIQRSMVTIQNGDYEYRIEEDYGSEEFHLLKETFNKLMNEIVNLKISSYEKQILMSQSELKAIKLQIRPHFFLNALTTISSLSQQNKNEEIKLYIDSLSKNVRYMFKSGLHTVTLGEEIQHVENYFEMQELKYPGCVFYFIDIPEELKTWRIPQMLINTVIENEFKYAVAMNSLLTILIKAFSVEKNGKEYLQIEIEDDGKGYPESILDSFKSGAITLDKSRVGLSSLKRMLEIMYEEDGLFTISNIEPHGCKNVFLLPEKPVQEIRDDSLIKID